MKTPIRNLTNKHPLLKRYKLIIFCLFTFSCFFITTACEDFVAVELPASQLNAAAVFEEAASANAALLAIYAEMRDESMISALSYTMGLYADELDYYGTTDGINILYTNSLLPSSSTVGSWWNNSYHLIYSANAIIEKTAQSQALSEEERNQLIGEALFVRAFIHFYLTNLYGAIPYITSTDYNENQIASKMTSTAVYSAIIDDLIKAAANLKNNYLLEDRTRPNKATVMALLARVYLYTEQWEEASNAASYVLNLKSQYSWETDLNKVFLKESSTTLWQWAPKTSNGNTREGETFIFTSVPPSNVALTAQQLSAFETNDLRKTQWTKEVTNHNNSWSHAYKYKERSTSDPSKEHTIIFRLAELYLIRAEARAQFGDIIGAADDLNILRTRAGLPNTPASDKESLLRAISAERSAELFTEMGHRFFDLKRTKQLDILSASKKGWEASDELFPIPENELLINPNLAPQNPGYN